MCFIREEEKTANEASKRAMSKAVCIATSL